MTRKNKRANSATKIAQVEAQAGVLIATLFSTNGLTLPEGAYILFRILWRTLRQDFGSSETARTFICDCLDLPSCKDDASFTE